MEKIELQGTWTKDEEGFMEFETSQLQRLYETVTDSYHHVYNQFLEETDDEEDAHYKALEAGYEMITDYKEISGITEFVTTYKTPAYVADIWYETDEYTGKKVFDKGFIRISGK
ncbi:hypothetical protein I5M27_10750 [Adhaeribacter sp. BT258]|uniref:Uncharacterized protein n=1 Tax=Adhaeribacter terrigena TaxID=2793070 RepID=A0ABS1C251_9BACT|nr:hypothetical protein [Adhaeribacter terrigena]MBK0403465.1 hypothetical protein [Adhaeribacter terrigena]